MPRSKSERLSDMLDVRSTILDQVSFDGVRVSEDIVHSIVTLVNDLCILADGSSKTPGYRGVNKPRPGKDGTIPEDCLRIYQARQRVIAMCGVTNPSTDNAEQTTTETH